MISSKVLLFVTMCCLFLEHGCTSCGDICKRTSLNICVLASSATDENVKLADEASRELLDDLKKCVVNNVDTIQAVQICPLIELQFEKSPVNPVTSVPVSGYAMGTYLVCKEEKWVVKHELLHAILFITRPGAFGHTAREWECIK